MIPIPGHNNGFLPQGGLSKKGHKLKYVGKLINHTPGTLCAIPLLVLNLNPLAKLTQISIQKGSHYITQSCEQPPLSGPVTFSFTKNGVIVERSG